MTEFTAESEAEAVVLRLAAAMRFAQLPLDKAVVHLGFSFASRTTRTVVSS